MAGKFERTSFLFNSTRVYDALFLKERVPTFFTGCSATILKIIEKKNIPHDQYFFAGYTEKSGYKACSPDYKARRLLIKEDWVHANVPGFGSTATPVTPPVVKPAKQYPPAPSILFLTDEEKFRDEDGNVIEIEVRGERRHDAIWFKARHIEKMLEMQNILGNLTNTDMNYELGKHYRTFNLSHSEQHKPCLRTFITFTCLMRLVFASQRRKAFFYQEQVGRVYSNILRGSQHDTVHFVEHRPYTKKLPCIYLIRLTGAKHTLPNIDDGKDVFKVGLTDFLDRRLKEHKERYGSYCKALDVVHWSYINPHKLHRAESLLLQFCKEMRYDHLLGSAELISCDAFDVEKVIARMKEIEAELKGDVYDLLEETETLRNRIRCLEEKNSRTFIPQHDIQSIKMNTFDVADPCVWTDDSAEAEQFRSWASEKLFTIRHGTSEQRTTLAAELLNITPRVLRATLNTCSTAMSALYLFELGRVKDLRSHFAIPDLFPDESKLYKFGMTEDLSARTQQHENYYGKMPGVNLVCVKYAAIDPNHLTTAECDLKRFFEEQEMRLSHPNFRELAVVSDRELKKVVFREYRDLGDKYAGRLAPLKQEIDRLTEKGRDPGETHGRNGTTTCKDRGHLRAQHRAA